ncbi:MAG TPA: hypothetical protein VJV23_00200 [Candidatus Polarisedimenticolia bacterium]|nr:hypothetical protein [Candidatus Polarisedimenticolia bacterium]
MGMIHFVNIYRRQRGSAEEYRFLLAETSASGGQALAQAGRIVDALRREFADYEFVIVRGAASLRDGSEG